MEEKEIINRVAGSSLVTLNLEDLYPREGLREVDLKEILFQSLVLREKDLREYVRNHDWSQYKGMHVAIHCSADAIIPTWAYMLIGIAVQPYASTVVFGDLKALIAQVFHDRLHRLDWEKYRDSKVVIKGCSDVHVPESAFLEASTRLREVASSIFYGEPCSTVPLFKKSK